MRRGDGKASSLGGELGGLLVPLVLVKDADGDVEREPEGVFSTDAVVVGFDRRVGCAISVGKLDAGIGDGDGGDGGFEVGPCGKALLLEIIHGVWNRRRNDVADDV